MADYSLLVNVAAVDRASAVFKKLQSNANTFKSQVENVGTVGQNSMSKLGSSMQNVGKNMSATGMLMTATITAPVVGLGVASTKAAIDFEEAFTGVRKTVDTTEENFEKLSSGIKQMSTETASSKTEIAGVMEVAGQLGVEVGKEGKTLLSFTRTMIELGDTTNLSAEEAATALAHFTNITGTAQDKVSNLGSAIVDLGNNFATDEASILNMSTRLASAGTIAGLTSTDILALSTAMSSVGIQAEAGGTAMAQTLASVSNEVANFSAGTENNLDRIAEIAGMSAKDFAAQWQTKPIAALQAFIGGLGTLDQKGENATLVLDELGMSGVRQANMLQSLALASDVLGDAITTSSTAFEENTALSAEAEKRYGTTASKISQLKEEFTNCAVTVGETLIPFLKKGMEVVSGVAKAFNSLPSGMQELIVKGAMLAAVAGPLLSIGGKLISGGGTIITMFSKLGEAAKKTSAPLEPLKETTKNLPGPLDQTSSSIGSLSKNALGFVALGAGILLAATGLALLAQSAIAISQAGAPAAIAMGAMVAVIAGLAVGAAVLGPALTAGAVGLVAFGAAITLVGVGVLAASAGLSILAPQIPILSEYGGSASIAVLELSGALVAFAAGALAATAGSIALGAGLLVAAAGATAAGLAGVMLTVAVVALSAAIVVAAGAVGLLGMALSLCATPIVIIGDNATTAAGGLGLMAAGMAALLLPLGMVAVLILGASAALLAFEVSVGVGALAVLAMSAALLMMDASMISIADAASTASEAMSDIQGSLDIVKAGISGLGDLFDGAVDAIISIFTNETETAMNAAVGFGTAIVAGTKAGLLPAEMITRQTVGKVVSVLNTAKTTISTTTIVFFAGIVTAVKNNCKNISSIVQKSTVQSNTVLATNLVTANTMFKQQLGQMLTNVKATLKQIQNEFRSTKLQFDQHIALPRFTMSGSFNAKTRSAPTVSVSWYRKAYDQSYMFQTPTVVSAAGFGDGNGAEIVSGDQHLIDLMRDAFSDVGGDIIIPIYVGQERIDEMIVTAQQRNNYRSGGR